MSKVLDKIENIGKWFAIVHTRTRYNKRMRTFYIHQYKKLAREM